MGHMQTLDLSDTLSFLSLLKLKSKLADVKAGDILEVILNNQDTITDLERIVRRSKDRISQKIQDKDRFRIRIVKGNTNA